MTLQQLEYIVALDTYRHFSTAAEKCFVTQPTLSTMIQKLEEELGVKLFDRGRQPILPTDVGTVVVEQARHILQATAQLRQLVRDEQETLGGDLHLGIIPTLAPYLLPLFLHSFGAAFPGVQLQVTERTTETIVELLKKGQLDVGLLATPLHDRQLDEAPLFWEEFVVYAPLNEPLFSEKRYLLPDEIDVNRLILLEEGHCMRSQIVNLCALKRSQRSHNNLQYEAGSLETLRRLVEHDAGITILPELALLGLEEDKMQHVRFFHPPAPVREISLVTHRGFIKRRLIEALRSEILKNLPPQVQRDKERRVVEIR